ncbi:MAG: sigma-70 family RNA polymerase sigma factor [Planctomycetota bacterium]
MRQPDSQPEKRRATSSEELAVMWSQVQPAVVSFISSAVTDFNDVEDVLQEVAAAAARNFAQYDPTRPFLGWVLGIARYKVLDYQRKHYQDHLIFSTDVLNHLTTACEQTAEGAADRHHALKYCVKKLHERGQKMLELRYTHGLSPVQISGKLGMKPNAVGVAMHRIRTALRTCITRYLKREGTDEPRP